MTERELWDGVFVPFFLSGISTYDVADAVAWLACVGDFSFISFG